MTTDEVQSPRPVRRWALGGAACLLPLIAMFLSPARADAALAYIGLLPAFVALTAGPRVSLATAGGTGAAVFIGLLLSSNAWAAAIFMITLGLGVAWSYRHGWQAAATYVATQGALAAVAAPQASFVTDRPASSAASAAVVAGLVLVSGLWVSLMGFLFLHDVPVRPAELPTADDLWAYALALSLALGVGTFLVMSYSPTSNGWWILLTVLVVLEPGHRGTMRRALERSGGTILGGGLAAVAVVLINSGTVISVLGLLAAIASAITYVRAPYWAFSATLTMALVLLVIPVGRALRGDLERVGFTVLAAVLVVALSALMHRLQRRRHEDQDCNPAAA